MTKSPSPSSSLEFSVFSVPESHRAQLRSEVEATARLAVGDFPSNLNRLTDLLKRLDSTNVLATFVFHGLWTTIDDQGRSNEAMPQILPHHAELLQAIALTNESAHWHGDPPTNEMETIFDLVEALSNVPRMKYLVDNLEKRYESKAVQDLLVRTRMNTQVVRNWDYYQDAIKTARDLYHPLARGLRRRLGFDVGDLLTLASTMKSLVEYRMERHVAMLAEVTSAPTEKERLARYYSWNPELNETPLTAVLDALESKSVEVNTVITSHSSLFLPEIYIFDISTLSTESALPATTTEAILRQLALAPGSLAGTNPEHLFLQNPVWLRPVISLGGSQFMIPLTQAIFSHLYLIVKDLAEQGRMLHQLDRRRSEYLEKEIANVLTAAIPMARIAQNKKWSWQNSVFETDCLLVLDRVILVVEAKSSRLTPDALRAAPGSLKNLIEKIVFNPSMQSERLLAVIENAKQGDKKAATVCDDLQIDPSEVDAAIRLSITLDDISVLYTAEQLLKDAKWMPSDHQLPVTMTIHDFKHVVHVLANPIFLFHYLNERYYVQKRWQTLVADELDLLGVYLRTGMNIAEIPASRSDVLVLTGESNPIDRHYNARDAGFSGKMPEPNLRPLFQEIIDKLSASRPPRWITIGRHILSSADYHQQEMIEKKLNRLRKIVRRRWRSEGHKCSLVITPPEMRKAAIAFYLFPESLRPVSRDRAAQLGRTVLDKVGHTECCVLVKSIEDWRNPYEAILLIKSN